jgi:multidrug resistance efflux pump
MIKNVLGAAVALALAGAGCHTDDLTDGRYQGMIEYDQRDLAFEMPGRVVELSAVRGQDVAAGAVIARQDDALDQDARQMTSRQVAVAKADLALVKAGSRIEDIRAAQAQLMSARAAEVNARKELDRQRTLVSKGALPAAGLDLLDAQLAAATGQRQAAEERLRALRKGARPEEIDRAEARVAQAAQALAADDTRLEKRRLTASTGGVVQDVYLEQGEMAAAGSPVVSVVDVHHPYADVFVPVAEAPHIRLGDVATLRVEGLAAEAHGRVEQIYPGAEFTPRFVFSPRERPNLMMRIRVRVDDPEGRFHAGLPAYARFGGHPAPHGESVAGSGGAP